MDAVSNRWVTHSPADVHQTPFFCSDFVLRDIDVFAFLYRRGFGVDKQQTFGILGWKMVESGAKVVARRSESSAWHERTAKS